MRQSTIDAALAALPATKPQLSERLQVTLGRAQQIITELKKAKLVKPFGVVTNQAGGLVQRFAAIDHPEEDSVGLLDIREEKEEQR